MATTTIEDTLEQLHKGLDQLRVDLRKRARDTARTVQKEAPLVAKRARAMSENLTDEGLDYARGWISAGRKAWDGAGGSIDEVRESALAVAAKAREVMAEAASQADYYSRNTTKQVRTIVRERPVTSVLVAAAAGLLIARLFSRD
jgi:ElaB/YqjD/DUF883 family membrane-anchored ribosome-binding protein